MKQLAAMAWKEWHEIRAFLWIGLSIFIGLPAIAGLEAYLQYSKNFDLSATPWVLMFGGVLAVFVAVGATCRDFSGHLEDFWRSRPVSPARWLIVKYLVGLIVVLAACIFPLILEAAVSFTKESNDHVAIALSAMIPALYSLGFFAGCLIRRMAHAAMLALAALLLVYFLPVVFPPLKWLSTANIDDDWGLLKFAAGMLGLATVALSLSLFAVSHSWRIESGRKMMYGSIALAILILFASASYQLGTNMPILQQAALTPGQYVSLIRYEGNQGFFLTERSYLKPNPTPEDSWQVDVEYRTVELTPSGIQLGLPHAVGNHSVWPSDTVSTVSPPGHPQIAYRALEFRDESKDKFKCWLHIWKFDKDQDEIILPLWERPSVDSAGRWYDDNWVLTYLLKDRLYVIGHRLVILDITDPVSPKVISNVPFTYFFVWGFTGGGDKFVQYLPPVPQLSPRQRLEAIFNFASPIVCLEGDTLCKFSNNELLEYRLTKLTQTAATFEKVGQYDPSILESAFGSFNYGSMQMQNGLLYVMSGPYSGDPWRWGRTWRTLNPHITVFDTRGPKPLRLVGHFAAPGAAVACPLPDGKVLVGGDHLWLVGPPPRRDSN